MIERMLFVFGCGCIFICMILLCDCRLVAARHIEQNKEYEQLLAEQSRSSFTEEDLGIRTGGISFSEPSDKKRERRSESIVSSVGGASVGGVSDNEEAGGGANVERTRGGSVLVPYCIPGPSGIGHGNETPEPESTVGKSFKKGKRESLIN